MKGIVCLTVAACTAIALGQPANAAPAQHRCHLGNGIEHVFYLQFDNVHLRRDNPNVPSDLEQMPNLLNFLEGDGTLFTKHYTPLISHTSVDILTDRRLWKQIRCPDRQQYRAVRRQWRRELSELIHLLD